MELVLALRQADAACPLVAGGRGQRIGEDQPGQGGGVLDRLAAAEAATAADFLEQRLDQTQRRSQPRADALEAIGSGADARFYVDAQTVNAEIRREKSLQGMKIKTPVNVVIAADAATLNSLRMVEQEISSANTAKIVFEQGDALKVSVQPSEEPGGAESQL